MIRLFTYQDDDSGIIKYQRAPIESDFPVWVFVKLWPWDYHVCQDESPAKYHCEIVVASPDFVSAENVLACQNSMGWGWEWYRLEKREQAWQLAEYGIAATLWQSDGNNERVLWKAARDELRKINMLFGFYLDKQQNAIGNSGWDFLRGEIGFIPKKD